MTTCLQKTEHFNVALVGTFLDTPKKDAELESIEELKTHMED